MNAEHIAESLDARGVHHMGVAVPDLGDAIALWSDCFGASLTVRRELHDQGVEAAALTLPTGEIELIAPLQGRANEGPAASFIARRGPGLHHVALSVVDITESLARAKATGLRLVDEAPRLGLHGVPIAFLHPAAAGGVLVELIEAPVPTAG